MPHFSFQGRTGLRRPQPPAAAGPVTGGGLTLDTGAPLTLDTTTPPAPGAGLPLQAGLQGVPFASPSLFSQQPTEPPRFQGGLRGNRARRPSFQASQLRGNTFTSSLQF